MPSPKKVKVLLMSSNEADNKDLFDFFKAKAAAQAPVVSEEAEVENCVEFSQNGVRVGLWKSVGSLAANGGLGLVPAEKNPDCICFVYDAKKANALGPMKQLIRAAKEDYSEDYHKGKIVFVLIGHNAEYVHRGTDTMEGEALAQEEGLAYFETSVDGRNKGFDVNGQDCLIEEILWPVLCQHGAIKEVSLTQEAPVVANSASTQKSPSMLSRFCALLLAKLWQGASWLFCSCRGPKTPVDTKEQSEFYSSYEDISDILSDGGDGYSGGDELLTFTSNSSSTGRLYASTEAVEVVYGDGEVEEFAAVPDPATSPAL